jgi:AAA domain/Ankyrin repeats (many copies)/UvrD-like helicase C-terminal domain
MRLLAYKDLDTRRVKASYAKVRAAIEADDFRSADVKKLTSTPYWRAKLDYANRVLLQFARHGDETVCLALEIIENHAYDKSRFLRGATVDEAKIEQATTPVVDAASLRRMDAANEVVPLRWLHAQRNEFELLDKPIVFDDAQEAIHRLPAPVVIVGSAGSGKTAVTLTKLREASGKVLYVTQSAYLAQSARGLYDAHAYNNPDQEVDFLSYREFVETLKVPAGREVTFTAFRGWFERHRQTLRQALGDMDAHALYEEFRGVISSQPQGPLDLERYLALGTKQSLLDAKAREAAHTLFGRYREWLIETKLFDLNLVAHEWQPLAEATYDFVVVDEVQDLTNVQLALVLACLKNPDQFLLCGDSNQIVHPNFFSWAAVRTLFWHGLAGDKAQNQTLSVLQANFRNTKAVTELANGLLKIKQARFGSIDRESNFLVDCASKQEGKTRLLPARDATLRELDLRSRASISHAIIVLRDEDKSAARAHFRSPLIFSVHEAKGLEYPNVILYALVSGQRAAYAEVCEGVRPEDLQVQELEYRRGKDKGDKSLELYKFYVNALYVAMTRAVESLVLVESDTKHPLFGLLGLQVGEAAVGSEPVKTSTKEEWAQEARKLEQQGKEEQARAIREAFLQSQAVPWKPWSAEFIEEQIPRALDRSQPSNKPRQSLLEYALWHGQHAWVEQLASEAQFAPARALMVEGRFPLDLSSSPYFRDDPATLREKQRIWNQPEVLRQRHLQPYIAKNFKDVLRACDTYGVDHRCTTGSTPLMMAARAGNLPLIDALLERGANPQLEDEFGHTPWLAALSRAAQDLEFTKQSIGPLFERLANGGVLDVQTGGRLIRLEHHQGEYWVLSLMMASFKTLRTRCRARKERIYRYRQGFFADDLNDTLSLLPQHLWDEKRQKRTYLNGVLARAEVESTYRPARQLWIRNTNGHYLINPQMQLRTQGSDADWRPVYEALNLSWVNRGTGDATIPIGNDLELRLAAFAQSSATGPAGSSNANEGSVL